jgi:hypothetical protein
MTKSPGRADRPDQAALEGLPSIYFDRWKFSIQTAMDLDQLMLVVSAYLSVWNREQLSLLPREIANPVIRDSDDLVARAVVASRAEIQYAGTGRGYVLLREMTLTLTAAVARFRYLQAVRAGRA